MKVILYMAMSVNGYIAEENGNEDFLSKINWDKFCALARECGNFIVGRKTYEAVRSWGNDFNFDDLVGVKKVIISHDKNYELDNGYTLAASPTDALAKLQDFNLVLVTGGSNINNSFIKDDLLDEVIFNVEPVLVGKGIPVIADGNFSKRLEFISSDQMEGIVNLRYKFSK